MIEQKMPRLTPEEVEHFRQNGYTIYRESLLPPDKFDGLKNHFENKLAQLPPDQRPETMDVPHLTDPTLFQWLFDDAVLDLVQPILGDDIALFASHFICKPAGDGLRVPWHEDSAYWNDMLSPMEVVTVWLAIDPSNEENGCMQVIPGSHLEGDSQYEGVDTESNLFKTEIVESQMDESKAVPFILEPNQCSLHDGRIVHGSKPNSSKIRRCGYTMRYISSHVRFNREKHGNRHHIYLARGRDHAGNVYGDPEKSYNDLMEKRRRR